MSDDEPRMCVVCHRQPPERGLVCGSDRDALAGQLYGVIGQVRRLEAELSPGARRGDGVRVSASKGNAPLPTRLDALSLLGPGSGNVTAMLHPQVRHWQTTHEAYVTSVRSTTVRENPDWPARTVADVVTELRTIVQWHRELALDDAGKPLLVADDDQIGTLPPREWLESWSQLWQERFLHGLPRPGRSVPWPNPRGGPKTIQAAYARATATVAGLRPVQPPGVAALAVLAADPVTAPAVAAMKAIKEQYDTAVRDTLSGRSLGYAGDRTRWSRTDDPAVDDLIARFGDAGHSTAVARSVAYLLLWLDDACDRDDTAIGDFAGELRSMSAELARVLGEQPDQMWLGRCPARITDLGTEQTRLCGAGIWQDPHASQVQCPRCHSTWGPRRVELLHLAIEMRRSWPVDRRRLYTVEERKVVRRPRCRGCGVFADIRWREVTPLGSKIRVWQPVGASCSSGCDEAKQVI